MQTRKKKAIPIYVVLMLLLVCMTVGCSKQEDAGGQNGTSTGDQSNTLVIGAYSVAKDAVGELLPEFQAVWKAKTGQTVHFQESYEASGTQARAIVGGFEADVALLAMESDIDKLVKADLVSSNWKQAPNDGMITRSIVVLGTRAGNPLGIRDFEDLTKPGVKVLYPNPKTSGGAQWDINAIYGAGLKLSEEQGKKDPAVAKAFLEKVHENVESLDKSGRSSMAAFEYGVGDVIVTYENELLARIAKGVNYDIVVPKNTILIENPAVVVDKYADKHGNRELAQAFIAYLRTPEAQRIFAKHGFRSVDPEVFAETKSSFPTPEGLFDINYLGGWDKVRSTLYSKRGVWYQVLAGL
ncbi:MULTISPECIES: sulfate ABC transporter substrate-binding protein [unclassified Paenibacillus]|uniref:sulfate ABC transporter substrate-binding protein n=1 Tax=unclassified Paenibacillus TaxID=185978 RepID=UPI0003F7804C|nr:MULTISPECIES: sulfate ABC transporter substrate-binding protein [unclassified Paenibacillus]KGP83934.1 sulfate ABC transporter substrate-binding protein [Paenibacillus sp. MAEPY2]KGP88878.1 sulfate ABC transporter substrate-binding protein [Paenibacillus sp. MAEPY1]